MIAVEDWKTQIIGFCVVGFGLIIAAFAKFVVSGFNMLARRFDAADECQKQIAETRGEMKADIKSLVRSKDERRKEDNSDDEVLPGLHGDADTPPNE